MSAPSVGIFWFIKEAGHELLLADGTPLDLAERYGECLTHPTGHAEFWEALGRRGPRALAARGLPKAPAWREYEEFPRGRVVFKVGEARFVIYADRRIQGSEFIERVVSEFSISEGRYSVESDSHYRSATPTAE